MAYLLTDILQELYIALGQAEMFPATGGSATTIINTKIGERAIQPEENYAIDFYAFVRRDAGGASAAPEGDYRRVSAYDSGTFAFTVDTAFSSSSQVASGDVILLASNVFPLQDMIGVANVVQKRLMVTLPDVTLTTVADQQLYNLPVTAKRGRPRMVRIQNVAGDNDSYIERFDYEYIPATAGTVGGLIFTGGFDSGLTIQVFYDTEQGSLTSQSSTLSETIPPALFLSEFKVSALEWYNSRNGGVDDYWKQRENMARDELMDLRKRMKEYRPRRGKKYFNVPAWY